jgi:hypothetical protein
MSKSSSSLAEASFPQKISEAIVLLRQRPAERDKAESIPSTLDSIDDYRWTYANASIQPARMAQSGTALAHPRNSGGVGTMGRRGIVLEQGAVCPPPQSSLRMIRFEPSLPLYLPAPDVG